MRDTRRALLDTARELFAEKGFGGTRTEDVVQRAGLTRGALYHLFREKEDLFRAVHDEVGDEVVQLLRRRDSEPLVGAWALFRANSEIYLEAASTNPAYRQICLIDGPAVLGWRSWSERNGGPTAHIIRYLNDAVAEGAGLDAESGAEREQEVTGRSEPASFECFHVLSLDVRGVGKLGRGHRLDFTVLPNRLAERHQLFVWTLAHLAVRRRPVRP